MPFFLSRWSYLVETFGCFWQRAVLLAFVTHPAPQMNVKICSYWKVPSVSIFMFMFPNLGPSSLCCLHTCCSTHSESHSGTSILSPVPSLLAWNASSAYEPAYVEKSRFRRWPSWRRFDNPVLGRRRSFSPEDCLVSEQRWAFHSCYICTRGPSLSSAELYALRSINL